jgi:hypothetical protein
MLPTFRPKIEVKKDAAFTYRRHCKLKGNPGLRSSIIVYVTPRSIGPTFYYTRLSIEVKPSEFLQLKGAFLNAVVPLTN